LLRRVAHPCYSPLIDCEHAHESISGDFSRLAIYGDALVRLAKAHQTAGNIKAALGIYKKARAAFFIASCIKPSCQKRVAELETVIENLMDAIGKNGRNL